MMMSRQLVVLLLVTVLACHCAVHVCVALPFVEGEHVGVSQADVSPSQSSTSTSASVLSLRSRLQQQMRFATTVQEESARVHTRTGFDARMSKGEIILNVPLISQQFVVEGTGASRCRNTW